MYGDELLQTSPSSKPEHGAFSSPEEDMRVFGPVVLVTTDLLAVFVSNVLHSSTVRRTAICDDDLGVAVSLHCFS